MVTQKTAMGIIDEELRRLDAMIEEVRYKMSSMSAVELAFDARWSLYSAMYKDGVDDEVRRKIVDIAEKVRQLMDRLRNIAETIENEAKLMRKRHNIRNRIKHALKVRSLINENEIRMAVEALKYEVLDLLKRGAVRGDEARLNIWRAIVALDYINNALNDAVDKLSRVAESIITSDKIDVRRCSVMIMDTAWRIKHWKVFP